MRVRIRSDGTPTGTVLENAETGERIERVTAIEWRISADGAFARATIELAVIPAEVIGDAELA